MHTASFTSVMDTPEDSRRLVSVKVPKKLVDMFGRPYPRKMVVWVHHFDDYGVMVEGTYEVKVALRALEKAGYTGFALWGYRPVVLGSEAAGWPLGAQVGGVGGVAFYFDVVESM